MTAPLTVILSKLRISDGEIHYRIQQQDGSMQPMTWSRDGASEQRESRRLAGSQGQGETEVVNHPNRKKKSAERAVLVTTTHRGVFFGYTDDTSGAIITLKRARNCVYWPSDQRGFLGLAVDGPKSGAKIGPAAEELELRDITSVAACSDAAVKAWEGAPWAR